MRKLRWQKLNAEGIEQVAYDLPGKKLYTVFRKSEKVYIYLNLDEELFSRFMEQEHKTTFLNKEIKGSHPFKVMDKNNFLLN